MLSKGAVVMLPVVILILAWWRRGRISRRDLLRSVPFFVVSAAMGVVEVWFQSVNVIGEIVVRDDTLPTRIAGAGWVVWFYIYKALLPLNLSFVYPRWEIDAANWLSYIPDLALMGVFILFWIYRWSWGRPFLFALGFFVLMVAPATGFAHFYFLKYSFVADHYQYMSIIGIIGLVVGTGYFLTEKLSGRSKEIAKAAAVLLVVVLGTLSWHQSRIYKDAETLWHDTLDKNPDAWLAHNNLGTLFQAQGRLEEAASHYRQALRVRPDFAESLNNLGIILSTQGKLDEAIDFYLKAIKSRPDLAAAHQNLGDALSAQGKSGEAVTYYLKALKLRPDVVDVHGNLGVALVAQGRIDEAVGHFNKALEIKPGNSDFINNLAWIFAVYKDTMFYNPKEAIRLGEKACELSNHENPTFLDTLAAAYAAAGRFSDAVDTAQKALNLATFSQNTDLTEQIQNRLHLYKVGQPYIEHTQEASTD
jgi:tetratricopeptide (TPR) repeat protein